LLALFGTHHIFHVSRIRAKERRLKPAWLVLMSMNGHCSIHSVSSVQFRIQEVVHEYWPEITSSLLRGFLAMLTTFTKWRKLFSVCFSFLLVSQRQPILGSVHFIAFRNTFAFLCWPLKPLCRELFYVSWADMNFAAAPWQVRFLFHACDLLYTLPSYHPKISTQNSKLITCAGLLIYRWVVWYSGVHHHHKHQGLDPLIRSVSRVTAARSNASSVLCLLWRFWVG